MRAWIVHDFNDMRLEDVPEPVAVPPGWAKIRVLAVQPSITECLLFRGLPTYQLDFVRETLQSGPTQLFGHEYCGEVVEVGQGVTDLKVGQRVASRSLSSCGRCWLCLHGRSDDCQKGPITGFQIPGCFAELAVVPADTLVPIPDHISNSVGAALQSLLDAVAGVAAADIKPGSVCVVIGQGVMGLGAMQAARVRGASTVIGIDVRDVSLAMARRLGADVVIDARSADPVETVLELTGGKGADVVIDAAGGPPEQGLAGAHSLDQAARMVCDEGIVVGTALLGEGTFLPYHSFRHRSIRYVFPAILTRGLLAYVVDLVATQRILLEPTITTVLHGLENVPQAFELTERKDEALLNPAQVIL